MTTIKKEEIYYQYFTGKNIKESPQYFVPFSIFAFVKPYKTGVEKSIVYHLAPEFNKK